MAQDEQDQQVTLGTRVPKELRWKMREVATLRRTTLEHEVRVALERHLAEAEREGPKARP